jgi:hypothetical protein
MFDLYADDEEEPKPFGDRVYALEFPKPAFSKEKIVKYFSLENWPKFRSISDRGAYFRVEMRELANFTAGFFQRRKLGQDGIVVVIGKSKVRQMFEYEGEE